jgi:hypothetical protein
VGLTLTTTVAFAEFVPEELTEPSQPTNINIADRAEEKTTGIQKGRCLPVRWAAVLLVENEPSRLIMAF